MKFKDVLLKDKKPSEEVVEISGITDVFEGKKDNPAKLLRDAGMKIKLTTGIDFGTQYTMAKKYDKKDIEKVLKDFDLKIKGQNIFVMNQE